MNKPLASYLVLDFMRPEESKLCIESLHQYTKFPFQIIYLSNGGEQDYVLDYYTKGLIHKLILNKNNSGLGIGTTDLFKSCNSEYAIYVQSDQFLRRTFAPDELEYIVSMLETQRNGRTIKSVSLAGDNAGNSQYSERAHLIRTKFYNDIPGKTIYGAGPYHNGEWNESVIQKYYKNNNYLHYIYDILFQDNGKYAVRQNPDGSKWRHTTDKKTLELLNGPIKEKFVYPNFTEDEWKLVLETQNWPKDQIPENDKKHSFTYWK